MGMGKGRRVFALVAVLAMVAVVAAGCGGGATGGGLTTVKLAIGAPLTQGATALGQGMDRGAKLAIKDNEEALKAAGLKMEPFSGDDQGDPKTGVNVANQFASDPAVIGVMGHLNSGVSIPASKVYNKANLVQISPASTNPALTLQQLNNVFRVCTIDSVQGPSGADSAFKDLGFKTAVVVDDSTPYGEGLAKAFADQFVADGGKVLTSEKTTDKDTDFNALVTKIKALNPDLIYYGGIYNAGALLAKQSKDAGMKAPLMGGDGLYDPTFVKLAGATQAEGDYATSVGLPISELAKGKQFTDSYKKLYPNDEIAAYDAYSYDAADVIIKAVIAVAKEKGAAAVTTVEGKKAIIAAVAKTDMEGVTGKISFDKNGDTTNKAITLYVVKSGAWGPWKK
ncbi:MAG TPA: branched-chain amino acid ABC transporter substrate-binding protein [Coriobacteriia bacterium]|jgi:branched-chain amino acid transport system substrate-binding protein